MAERDTRLDSTEVRGRGVTSIRLGQGDCWAYCKCGYSMRVPDNSLSTVKMPVFCCGCGKHIVFSGDHAWLPHAFVPRPKATMNWGGLKVGDQIPGCARCWWDQGAKIHSAAC